MATPWPQEAVWPTGLQEHTTQLIKYLRDTLECIVCENNQPVPPDLVKMIVRGTLSFIAKTQRTSDKTTVHDKVNTIHTEQNQTTKEGAKELASIREELTKTAAGVNESFTAAKQADAAALTVDTEEHG